ncbi:MAG: nucleotidyltransferase domain-containing protein [Desulfovermiculus sp.]
MDYQVFYLPPKDRDALCEHMGQIMLGRPEIVFAYVHGSFVTEDYFRDLDVAVWVNDRFWPEHSFAYEDGVAQEIVGEIHKEFPVDVRILNKTSIPLYEILSENLNDLDEFSQAVSTWL